MTKIQEHKTYRVNMTALGKASQYRGQLVTIENVANNHLDIHFGRALDGELIILFGSELDEHTITPLSGVELVSLQTTLSRINSLSCT